MKLLRSRLDWHDLRPGLKPLSPPRLSQSRQSCDVAEVGRGQPRFSGQNFILAYHFKTLFYIDHGRGLGGESRRLHDLRSDSKTRIRKPPRTASRIRGDQLNTFSDLPIIRQLTHGFRITRRQGRSYRDEGNIQTRESAPGSHTLEQQEQGFVRIPTSVDVFESVAEVDDDTPILKQLAQGRCRWVSRVACKGELRDEEI